MKFTKLALAGALAIGLSVPAFAQDKLLIGSTSASCQLICLVSKDSKLRKDSACGDLG